GEAVDQERAREAVHQRRKHLVEIGLRTQLTPELDQRAPVIVARAIEKYVQLLLNPLPYRIEQERGHYHGHHESVGAGTRNARVPQLAIAATTAKYVPTMEAA